MKKKIEHNCRVIPNNLKGLFRNWAKFNSKLLNNILIINGSTETIITRKMIDKKRLSC